MAQLAIVPKPHDHVVGFGYFVGGGDARPDRRESVERFAEPAAGLPGTPPLAARRHVDQAGVAEYGAAPIRLTDLLGGALDDERQLGFMHEDPRLGEFRQNDRVARPDDGLRVLQKHVERPRLALRVFPVIGDAAEDLTGPRQRSAQTDRTQRQRLAVCQLPFQCRPQPAEPVDQRLHCQLRGMALRGDARDVDDPALGQKPGCRLVPSGSLKQHQLHEFLPISPSKLARSLHSNHRDSRFDSLKRPARALRRYRWEIEMAQIRRMAQQIGVEVTGADVKTLDDAGFALIYQAWLDSNVLVVRDQELEIADFLRYSRRFGPVVPHPSKSTRHPEIPEITMLGINKFDADGNLIDAIYRRGAEGWHTDGAYNRQPFKATQLYALAVPSRGGDTLFANGYAAYDALPDRLKKRLDGVMGAFSYGGRRGGSPLLDKEDQDWEAVFHPIIRTHPETGRKSLYFDPGKIVDIVGCERSESDALIAELKGYMIQPDAEYRHKWRKGDIVIWDNRCSYHKAAGDYPPEEDRIHWRVSINDYGVEAREAAE